jgi:hypothetical protein
MDDIKIYGYSEKELQNVLVLIDNYLKGHGLSINSKKTGITIIDSSHEDNTIMELRRLEIIGNDYTGNELSIKNLIEDDLDLNKILGSPNEKAPEGEKATSAIKFVNELIQSNLEGNIIKSINSLSEQSPDEHHLEDSISLFQTITDPEEIVKFWEQEIDEAASELIKLFRSDAVDLSDPDNTDDIDFIRLSAKYGTALNSISEYKKINAAENLLPYWIFALKKFYWRASNFILTLQHYKGNRKLRDELISIYLEDKNYECYRYHLISCLTYNFEYTDKELREFFKFLKEEKSELVRYALYCLLIKHSDDKQLQSTLRVQLSREENNYLKLITLDYWKKDKNRINSMNELVKQMGL